MPLVTTECFGDGAVATQASEGNDGTTVGMSKRRIGEQRSVGQLFRLIFLWSIVTVGGTSGVGTVGAYALGGLEHAWAIAAAGTSVLLSGLITTFVAGRDNGLGGMASALAYIGKILLIVGFVALALRYTPADGRTLVISLIVFEIVSLITMSVVVIWGEGPGFDVEERDMRSE